MMVLEDGVLLRDDHVAPAAGERSLVTDGCCWTAIPFSEVSSAAITADGWVLRRWIPRPKRRRRVRLPLDPRDGVAARAIADFDRAWRAWQASSPPADAALFEPHGEEAVDTWFARCRGLGGRGASDYRGAALPLDVIWHVVESPSASDRVRIGAVVALGFSLERGRDGTGRLRRAGSASASPLFRAICDAQHRASTEEDVASWCMTELGAPAKSAYDG